MDVVLEVFDTFLFDRVYANLLPIHPSVSSFDPISTIAAGLKSYAETNATAFTDPTGQGEALRSAWQFEPASSYFSVQPSEFAYMSRWDRDNIYRQFVSFYIITW